jgi:Peroxiredoxin
LIEGTVTAKVLSSRNRREKEDRIGVLIEPAGIPLRGLFIIDPKGVLRQITVNVPRTLIVVPRTNIILSG